MGRPKALLAVAGKTLLEWQVERLGPGFKEVLVSVARDLQNLPPALQATVVFDLHRDAGPLAGVEAALAHAGHEVVFAVGCDLPAVGLRLARALVEASSGHDAAVPRPGGRVEPACAAYRRSAAGPIGAALRAGRFKAADALAEIDARYLDDAELAAAGAGPLSFQNLNTPADYEAFLSILSSQAGSGWTR